MICLGKDHLGVIADDLLKQAKAAGCYSAIIALSHENPPGHSSYVIRWHGRCLEVEGLVARLRYWAERIWVGKDDQ